MSEFKVTNVDLLDNIKKEIEILDSEGNPVNISTLVDDILSFVTEEFQKRDSGELVNTLFPLMTTILGEALPKIVDHDTAIAFLSMESTKGALIYSMLLAVLLTNYTHKNNLQVHTVSIPLTQEEKEFFERKDREEEEKEEEIPIDKTQIN